MCRRYVTSISLEFNSLSQDILTGVIPNVLVWTRCTTTRLTNLPPSCSDTRMVPLPRAILANWSCSQGRHFTWSVSSSRGQEHQHGPRGEHSGTGTILVNMTNKVAQSPQVYGKSAQIMANLSWIFDCEYYLELWIATSRCFSWSQFYLGTFCRESFLIMSWVCQK